MSRHSANGHFLVIPLPPPEEDSFLAHSAAERDPYPFPEVLPIMPCVGGPAGVLAASA
jgi:hypothetical protein